MVEAVREEIENADETKTENDADDKRNGKNENTKFLFSFFSFYF